MRSIFILAFLTFCAAISGTSLAQSCTPKNWCDYTKNPVVCTPYCFDSQIIKIGEDNYTLKLKGIPSAAVPDILNNLFVDRQKITQSSTSLKFKGLSRDNLNDVLQQLHSTP